MDNLVTLNSYPSRVEADLIKGLLEANGLEAFIVADDAGGMRPFPLSYTYGVELKVKSQDLEKARKILETSK